MKHGPMMRSSRFSYGSTQSIPVKAGLPETELISNKRGGKWLTSALPLVFQREFPESSDEKIISDSRAFLVISGVVSTTLPVGTYDVIVTNSVESTQYSQKFNIE
jgi:hypothetical protein